MGKIIDVKVYVRCCLKCQHPNLKFRLDKLLRMLVKLDAFCLYGEYETAA